jgi:hypothetical protein
LAYANLNLQTNLLQVNNYASSCGEQLLYIVLKKLRERDCSSYTSCAAVAGFCAVKQLLTIPEYSSILSLNARLDQEEQLTSRKRPRSHVIKKNKAK